MKPSLPLPTVITLAVFLFSAVTSPAPGRTLTDMNVIPTRVLQRSVSPKFYKSLLISPVQGWIVVRANLSGTRLSGVKIIRSELQGLYDPLALQLAKEAQLAGSFSLDRPNLGNSVLLHLLVYQIADGTMVLSFAHLDGPGGDQADYYGCARLLVLKNDKWTEIKGPESLHGKGLAVRQGLRNDYAGSLKLEKQSGPEAINMETPRGGAVAPVTQACCLTRGVDILSALRRLKAAAPPHHAANNSLGRMSQSLRAPVLFSIRSRILAFAG